MTGAALGAAMAVAGVQAGAGERPRDAAGYGLRVLLPNQCRFPDPESSDCHIVVGDELIVIRMRDTDMPLEAGARDYMPDRLGDLALDATAAMLRAPLPDAEMLPPEVARWEEENGADACARYVYETRAPEEAEGLTWSTVTGLTCLEYHGADDVMQEAQVSVSSYRPAGQAPGEAYRVLTDKVLDSFRMR